MNIIKKLVSELIPYANNSRTHSDSQVDKIAASIKEFGFMNPIILDGDNGVIAGHGRLMAAKKLKIKDIPCLEAIHLTEAQKKAYIIADNAIALDSDWDMDFLKVEIEGLDELDFDLDLLGLDEDIINNVEESDFPELADGDKDPFQQITFTLHDEQHDIVTDAVLKAKMHPEIDTGLNENSNGNAITYICEQWLQNVG